MSKSKKGELSINIIIVAILSLLVLVILITIFAGKLGGFRQESDTCEKNGGTCLLDGADVCTGTYESKQSYPCLSIDAAGKKTVDSTKICCIKVGK